MQLAPGAIGGKRENPAAIFETLRKIGVEFGSHFAVAALRLCHAGDGDELVAYSTISSA
jgi:hypothetical protein